MLTKLTNIDFQKKEAPVALLESIKLYGIIQPISVMQLSDGRFSCICGHMRCSAAQELDILEVPISIVQTAAKTKTQTYQKNLWGYLNAQFGKQQEILDCLNWLVRRLERRKQQYDICTCQTRRICVSKDKRIICSNCGLPLEKRKERHNYATLGTNNQISC